MKGVSDIILGKDCDNEPKQVREVLLGRSRYYIYPKDGSWRELNRDDDDWNYESGHFAVYTNDSVFLITAMTVGSSSMTDRHRLFWRVDAIARGGEQEQQNFIKRKGHHLPVFDVDNGELLNFLLAEIRSSEAMSGRVPTYRQVARPRWRSARWREQLNWYRDWRGKEHPNTSSLKLTKGKKLRCVS